MTAPHVYVILQQPVDQFNRLSLVQLLVNGHEHYKANDHHEQVNRGCEDDQPCGNSGMVKPDERSIDSTSRTRMGTKRGSIRLVTDEWTVANSSSPTSFQDS